MTSSTNNVPSVQDTVERAILEAGAANVVRPYQQVVDRVVAALCERDEMIAAILLQAAREMELSPVGQRDVEQLLSDVGLMRPALAAGGDDTAPAWARALVDRIDALESRLGARSQFGQR